ncbi:MAG: UDP-N-acetylglucosamine 1-carboxyvinyltransferase [Oscillospiraceae bacterium]|nr:UDP-N-acetylglucosamine 1-carboxyvinyltransferase [Oscillospiraceae bacterium]
MQILRMDGGTRIQGEARIESAKNAALPILAACVMTDEPVTLLGIPDIADVENMLAILRSIGCDVERDGSSITVRAQGDLYDSVPPHLAETLRSSLFLAGPLLARTGSVAFGMPGGCEIGLRPIDLHERGLRALGATLEEDDGIVRCTGKNLKGADIHLDYPSVGATENIMMAAALTPGKTVIHNAAREPEIVDLARFLNACGARVAGAGKQMIAIQGVKKLHGATYRPIPDRIVAGTLLAAAAITGGELRLTNAPVGDMIAQIAKLRDMGCDIRDGVGTLTLRAPKRLRSFGQLQTLPHPGFPTDMQAPMFALASVADGVSLVLETIFENRYAHASDLVKMGADVILNDRMAVVRGVQRLHGARVKARDLRAGAALVIAGLAAEGVTEIEQIGQIDRGYEKIEIMLSRLGARIKRADE